MPLPGCWGLPWHANHFEPSCSSEWSCTAPLIAQNLVAPQTVWNNSAHLTAQSHTASWTTLSIFVLSLEKSIISPLALTCLTCATVQLLHVILNQESTKSIPIEGCLLRIVCFCLYRVIIGIIDLYLLCLLPGREVANLLVNHANTWTQLWTGKMLRKFHEYLRKKSPSWKWWTWLFCGCGNKPLSAEHTRRGSAVNRVCAPPLQFSPRVTFQCRRWWRVTSERLATRCLKMLGRLMQRGLPGLLPCLKPKAKCFYEYEADPASSVLHLPPAVVSQAPLLGLMSNTF